MKFLYTLFFCTACAGACMAQHAKKESSIVQNPNETLATEIIYHFPEFTTGTVYFKDNSNSLAKLNYNQLTEQMQFLDPKGDTLDIANPSDIVFIQIGNDSFYLDKGAALLIASYPQVKLATKTRLREVDRQKIGGFGMTTSTSSINNYSSIQNNNRSQKLTNNEKIVYAKELIYYLVPEDGRFIPLNKSTIAKAFSIKAKQVEQYIAAEQLDLQKDADIRKLLTFAGSL